MYFNAIEIIIKFIELYVRIIKTINFIDTI